MKLQKTKERNIYFYFLSNGKKRFMYRYRYYDNSGKRREVKRSGFESEKKALRSLIELQADLLDGNMQRIQSADITVSEWVNSWYDSKERNWKPTTKSVNKNAISHISRLIGHKKLTTLTATEYEKDFINALFNEGLQNGGVKTIHEVFKTSINAAVDDEILTRNRFSKIKLADVRKVSTNFYTPTELILFLSEIKKAELLTPYALFFTLAYTGMRKGEACSLRWSDFNSKQNTLTIKNTRDQHGVRSPKTLNSYRVIEIDPELTQVLIEYRLYLKKLFLSIGETQSSDDYIFISEHTMQPISSAYPNYQMNKLYAKLEAKNISLKVITPHGLRHTHATALINMLVPPPDIANRLGNTVEMIHRVYSHFLDKEKDKTVSAFSEILKNAKST